MLGRRVDAHPLQPAQPGDRGCVDDAAARGQVAQGRAHAVEGPAGVDVHHEIPSFVGFVGEGGRVGADAGDVGEGVETAEVCYCGRKPGVDVRGGPHVEGCG